jgi:hypothetical protein
MVTIILVSGIAIFLFAFVLFYWDMDGWGFVSFMVGLLISSMAIVMLASQRDDRIFMNQLQQTRRTINEQRQISGNIENAAVTKEIIEINDRISQMRYDRKNWFTNLFVDPNVDTLTYLK